MGLAAPSRKHRTWTILLAQLVVFASLLGLFMQYVPDDGAKAGLRQIPHRFMDRHTKNIMDRQVENQEVIVQWQTEGADSNEDEEATDDSFEYDQNATMLPYRGDYRELFSLTTRSRKFYPIHMDGVGVYNPSLIPHPVKADQWVVVASHPGKGESEALYCPLGNLNDVLVCSTDIQKMTPPKSIKSEQCINGLEYMNFYIGPRDTRMFFGPDAPYVVYGSQSTWTCLGLWLQDARPLLNVFHIVESVGNKLFKSATELRRPPPFNPIEKNFFLFWDIYGQAYSHYDIYPRRSFAQINMDGTVSRDLALDSARHDKFCMAKYMPVPLSKLEDIHQATNSLLITTCKRSDPRCKATTENTFVMHIFQHKTCYDFHSLYEPYIVLFRQTPPFELYAIGQRPYWIHGRTNLTKETHAKDYEGREQYIPKGHSEMFYITSMNWKKHGRTYHGHIDDELWLTFGIEDSRAAAMDILAGDLLEDLAFC